MITMAYQVALLSSDCVSVGRNIFCLPHLLNMTYWFTHFVLWV